MIDWTPILVALVGGILSTIGIVATALINSRMRNSADALALSNAVKNSLGAIQTATDDAIVKAAPHTAIPGVTPQTAVGIQYVLDHAGTEAARLGVTPEAIASKVEAQIGLQQIAAAMPVQPMPAP